MRALCLSVLLFAAPALAFDAGETVYAKATTPSVRFADADEAGPTFDGDSRLTVLVADGDRLRVMSAQGGFGWVPETAVTTVVPASQRVDLEALLKNMDLEGVDMSKLGGGLGAGGAAPPPDGGP